jgi:uncharacterized protein YegJ (DUF2314 family)
MTRRDIVFIGGALIAGTAAWLWSRRRRESGPAPAGIVLLLQQPISLDASILAERLNKASGRSVRVIDANDSTVSGDKLAGDMITGESPHFMASVDGVTYVINNVPAPYLQDRAAASEDIVESRLRKAVAEHTAWISMDVMPPEKASPEAYRLVGRVLATLIDARCLALYHPPSNQFVACRNDRTIEQLTGADPIQAVFSEMTYAPVVGVGDDPRVKAAETEAKRRFPEFKSAFAKKDGTAFSVKTAITRSGTTEHIWVDVDGIASGKVTGTLGNEPMNLSGLKLGSRVEVEVPHVEDWTYSRNGEQLGSFTAPVIMKIIEEQSRKK